MDNLTHSLLGLALARTRLGRGFERPGPLFLVAANLPDVDVAATLVGGPSAYLEFHRGWTHSILGASLLSLTLLPFAARGRGTAREALGRFAVLLVVLFSHPALDALNVYGVRPFWPFSSRWVYGDLLFIVDPWCWLLFGAAALLAGPRRRWGDVGWFATGVLALSVVWTAGRGRGPGFLAPLFTAAVGLLGALRALGWGRGRPRAVLRAVALLVAAYLGAVGLFRAEARRLGRPPALAALGAEPLRALTLEPGVADPASWTLIAEGSRRVVWVPVEVGRRVGPPRVAAKGTDDPRVAAAERTRLGRAWRSFVRHPLARVRREADGDVTVLLSDARWAFADWCTVAVRLAAPPPPSPSGTQGR